MELFSALDNALSQKAEETLTEFAAVKKADVQLQTQLGNRKGQIAANIIGAFAESQSSAFGWQVRAFSAKDNGRGANVGIFFRRVDGESLYGINSFVDYEKGKYGDFLRYGIGGELQNRYVAFAMNLYLPITDDKHNGATVAFSQEGYDANLRINIPQFDFLKVRADYYHYSGEYGVENDNGFRYGLEVQPINDLRIGVFYDDGGEKFGGDIAYIYNISPPQKRESNFSPDLFSPVVREYSQRIITATTGPQIQVLRTPTLTTFMVSVVAAMTIRTTTEMLTIQEANNIARTASVHFTTRIDNPASVAGFIIATTNVKFLISLPPASQITRPLTLTRNRDWLAGFSGNTEIFRVIMNSGTPFGVGVLGTFVGNGVQLLTITITEGSEDYIAPAGLITSTLTTRMTMTILPITTTMAMTAFLTRTITLGLTTNAEADIDSRLPPSFPLSFPQVPKLALAAIPRISPSFPPARE